MIGGGAVLAIAAADRGGGRPETVSIRVGQLPPELPRTPSGRVQPDAAVVEFAAASEQVASAPRDPAAWFRMSLAYDAGRDRPRARAAMRHAIALEHGNAPDDPPERLRPPE